MRRADGKGNIKVNWRSRLLGFRIVEESDVHCVIRMPAWLPRSAVSKVAEHLRQESGMLDRGAGMSYRTAGRLLRIERAA